MNRKVQKLWRHYCMSFLSAFTVLGEQTVIGVLQSSMYNAKHNNVLNFTSRRFIVDYTLFAEVQL